MDSKAIRRANIRALAEEVGGVTMLAKMTGTSQSYLSQIIGPNPSREAGDIMARKVEQATGRPYGWLDETHITDTKKQNARLVYDRLLELPDAKIEAVMQLLNLVPASNNLIVEHVQDGESATGDENRKGRSGGQGRGAGRRGKNR